MKIKITSLALAVCILLSLFLTGCSLTPSNEAYEYTAGNDNFTLSSYTEHFTDGEDTEVRLSILTKISLIEYSVDASFALTDGSVIKRTVKNVERSVGGGSTFAVFMNIGDAEFSDIDSITVFCTGKSYETADILGVDARPRVTFMSDSQIWARSRQDSGAPVSCPDTPIYENELFVGWYCDKECTVPFDFTAGVTEDTVVYAGRAVNAERLINAVTTDVMRSIVTVHCTYTEDKLWMPDTLSSTSSGVVIRAGSTAYVLTNCHSVSLLDGYKSMTIQVEDCYGNLYDASVYSKGGIKAIDAEYDLACLVVSGMEEVTAIELASANPEPQDTVISLGSPSGQKNSVTVGRALMYGEVELTTEDYLSNVTFPVVKHTAQLRQGSSGGALINSELMLVGINYAGVSGDEFSDGYAIPIEKVHEFISKYL